MQLGKYQNALDYAMAALYLSPSNPEVVEQVKVIKEQIAAGMHGQTYFFYNLAGYNVSWSTSPVLICMPL